MTFLCGCPTIELNIDDGFTYYNRAETNRALGNISDLTQDYQRAAELFQVQNNTYWHQKALERLEELR